MKKIILIGTLAVLAVYGAEAQKSKQHYKVEQKSHPQDPEKRILRIERTIDGDVEVIEKEISSKMPRAKVYSFEGIAADTLPERSLKYGEGFSWEENFPRFSDRFRKEAQTLRFHLDDLSSRARSEWKGFEKTWEQAQGISNVSVFTNKPDTHVLNLRFKSSDEGTVTISVVNTVGERVAQEKVENFKGEYMGQLHLAAGSKGTYFVIIAQGERAVSRKVHME